MKIEERNKYTKTIITVLAILIVSGCTTQPTSTSTPISTPISTIVPTPTITANVLTPTPTTILPTTTSTPTATTSPTGKTVDIRGFAFIPNSITVSIGTTVTWINNDNVPHTVTSVSGVFDSGNINPGGTFSWTFKKVGTFEYSCTIHPNIPHGTVIVGGASTSASTPSPPSGY